MALIVDTNLMILLIVGSTSLKIIPKHKHTKTFTIDDYELLMYVIGNSAIVITPHIVAETSNLLRYHQDPELSQLMKKFKTLVVSSNEHYQTSVSIVQSDDFPKLGAPDVGILNLAKALNCSILTTDLAMYVSASSQGLKVRNFNHDRQDYGTL